MDDMTKQIALRIPDDLAARIDERADLIGLSRNAWLTRALEWAVQQPVTTHTREEKI